MAEIVQTLAFFFRGKLSIGVSADLNYFLGSWRLLSLGWRAQFFLHISGEALSSIYLEIFSDLVRFGEGLDFRVFTDV